MRSPPRRPTRRGTIMPLLALAGTSMCAMTALALDLGLLAISRTNCQTVADAAALTGTRTLDNKPTSTNSNQSGAQAAAAAVVASSNLTTNSGTPNTTTVRFGVYRYYDSTTSPVMTPPQFAVQAWYPAPSTPPNGEKSWTATEVTVTANQPGIFSHVFGTANLAAYGRAVAVYRPRDIAMTLDMTGSMKYGCTARGNDNYMSCDPLYPQAGHYARYTGYTLNNPSAEDTNTGATPADRQNPFFTTAPYNFGQVLAPNNYTVENAGGPPAVRDFYYDPANVSNPSNSIVTPNVPALKNAFHHWTPPEVSHNSPDTYIAATNDYSNWSSNTTPTAAGSFSVYPTPEAFKDQSAANFLGDKSPRKRGAERLASPGAWDVTAANGAAFTLAEYLGWTNRYSGGAVPTATSNTAGFRPPGQANGRNDTVNLTTKASLGRPNAAPDYANDWSDFRDATWEYHGYDMDVNAYVTNRGPTWDPRKLALPGNLNGLPSAALSVTTGRFKGYTMGPGYWGKSFFVWPPDPRTPLGDPGNSGYVAGDWRRRFFFKTNAPANAADTPNNPADPNRLDPAGDNNPTGGAALDSINAVTLTNGTGQTMNLPGANQVNYRAILKWIKAPPMALPPNLRAGRVVYYTSIPDDVDSSSGSADVQKDKVFWKAYIDFVVNDLIYAPNNYGLMEVEKKGWPEGGTPTIFQNAMGQYDIDASGLTPPDAYPYMNYMDNPSRPRAQFWFGPISMMAMLGSTINTALNSAQNAWAGTVHETQSWQLKAGVNSVLDDIRNNHPNDNVGLSYFTGGRYGGISVACSQDFDLLKASLFYPKPLVDSGDVWNNTAKEFRAFDIGLNWQGGGLVQNAQNSTDPNTGMATCFNILAPSASGNPALPALPPAPYGTAGATRRGRRGAAKIVLFETDGVPNAFSSTAFQAQGYNSYYTTNVGSTSGTSTWSAAAAPALAIVDQIRKPMSLTTSGDSGLSSSSSPARVYSIGFGDLFSISPPPQAATDARTFLLQVQQRGGTSAAGDAAIPAYQIITGPYQTRIDSLKTAFERILQSGVQVTLVE